MIKCSDYFIIKVKCGGDEKLKLGNIEAYNKHCYDRVKAFIEFKWLVIEQITGKLRDEWYRTYLTDANDCALDEIEEITGIHISRNYEDVCSFFIPKKYETIYHWIISNCDVPYKVLIKTNLTVVRRYSKIDLTRRRREALEWTKKMKDKYPNLYNL